MLHIIQFINAIFVVCLSLVTVSDNAQFWLKCIIGGYAFILLVFAMFAFYKNRRKAQSKNEKG
ncbi:hypothetical protein AK966_18750 [Vibrio sp. PID23_8]|jgi:F0F1-type ATP synthase assembly protein I|nr:hypothetical protein AK966_18750 [Vibrio sp. PID23_8]